MWISQRTRTDLITTHPLALLQQHHHKAVTPIVAYCCRACSSSSRRDIDREHTHHKRRHCYVTNLRITHLGQPPRQPPPRPPPRQPPRRCRRPPPPRASAAPQELRTPERPGAWIPEQSGVRELPGAAQARTWAGRPPPVPPLALPEHWCRRWSGEGPYEHVCGRGVGTFTSRSRACCKNPVPTRGKRAR